MGFDYPIIISDTVVTWAKQCATSVLLAHKFQGCHALRILAGEPLSLGVRFQYRLSGIEPNPHVQRPLRDLVCTLGWTQQTITTAAAG